MNKYIDAEKLKAEIEILKETHERNLNKPMERGRIGHAHGYVDCCDEILSSINSLQQEQLDDLHFTPLNRLIQKIPSEKWNDSTNNYAKKLRDCLIKEGYRKDAEVLQGYISYMNGNNVPMATMDEQEQPEVDLDEETLREEFHTIDSKCFNEGIEGWWREKLIARHFYELGIKAKKEE